MDLHMIGPWRETIMPPERISHSRSLSIDACPAPHPRIRSIRTDDPSCANQLLFNPHALRANSGYACSPKKVGAEMFSSFCDDAMQGSTAHRQAQSVAWKESCCRGIQSHETDPEKRVRFAQWHSNAEPLERRQSIRHQSFAACLVDWGALSVRDNHTKAALPCGNCRRQSCGPTTNYENIS